MNTFNFPIFRIFHNSWIECIIWIPRGYLCWINVGIMPLLVTVWCNNRNWLALSDLAHVKPLSRLWGMANGDGRNLSFSTFLYGDLNCVQRVILLHLTICSKYWDELTWDDLYFSLTSLTISNALSPMYSAITGWPSMTIPIPLQVSPKIFPACSKFFNWSWGSTVFH